MSKRAFALVASVLVLIVAGHALGDGLTPGHFVEKAGTYKLADGKVVVKVTEEGEKLRWKVTMTVKGGFETGVGPSTPTIAKDSPWFCYVTSAPVVWLYGGGRRLFTIEVIERTVKGQAIPVLTPTVVTLPKDWSVLLKKNPPREVLDRLPAGVRPPKKSK